MAYQISPAVTVTETDLTNVIPAVSSSIGASVIEAAWGPVMDVTSIDSENVLVQRFGKPNNGNAQSWFATANFLAYSGQALVVRSDTTGQRNAVAELTGSVTSVSIGAGGSGYTQSTTAVTFSKPDVEGGIVATGTAIVAAGVITGVTVTNGGSGYTSAPTVTISNVGAGTGTGATATATIADGGIKINNISDYEQNFSSGLGVVGAFAARYPGSLGNSISISIADAASFSTWDYKALFTTAPDTSDFVANAGGLGDEIHMVVIDRDGRWTGTAGMVIESYAFLSKALGAKKGDGSSAYYVTAVNSQSNYIYWMDHPTGMTNWGTAPSLGVTYTSIGATALSFDLVGGVDDYSVTDGERMNAFTLFGDDETYDVSLIISGKSSRDVVRHIIDNVVEKRRDCMVFASPSHIVTGDPLVGNNAEVVENIIKFKNGDGVENATLPSTSFAVFDSGYKYQYDAYNDVYRWVPLNGDVAGLCARTDYTNDPWFSPAGFNRGQIKNVIKLAFNPRKADRDNLYQNGINSVVSFPGEGVVLFGDKTALAKPSAFDRINVRRLFITLEKAIATAAKYQLFEFNDGFTRAQFRNQVEPFLRDVKGRRGIIDFKIICDETNNTGEVIDNNRFVADIYIKPTRSINFVTLNFVAVRTSATFTEITG